MEHSTAGVGMPPVEERGRRVAATVLEQYAGAGILAVEIGGQVFERAHDQETVRRHLEEGRLERRLRALCGPEAAVLLSELWGLRRDRERDERIGWLRHLGRLLMEERQDAVWRRLYLGMRHDEQTTDLIMYVIEYSDYRERDELRFVFGDNWREYLESREDEAADGAAGDPAAAGAQP